MRSPAFPTPEQPPTSLAVRARQLADAAIDIVQGRERATVRVEDYLTVLAATAGEAVLVASGVLDPWPEGVRPGQAVFGDPVNDVLTGGRTALDQVPAPSAVGQLVRDLVPGVVPLDAFPSIGGLYEHRARTVYSVAWGTVATTVPADHQPTVSPLQVAYRLRPAVDAAQASLGLATAERYIPCVAALGLAVAEVRDAIDLRLALQLSLEVLFGMAGMAPMTEAALRAAARDAPAPGVPSGPRV